MRSTHTIRIYRLHPRFLLDLLHTVAIWNIAVVLFANKYTKIYWILQFNVKKIVMFPFKAHKHAHASNKVKIIEESDTKWLSDVFTMYGMHYLFRT